MAQRRDPMVITLPGTPLFIRAAQMAACAIAAQLDLTYDRVCDIRTAVGEACDHVAPLSRGESGEAICLSLLVDGSKLSVSVSACGPRRTDADPRDEESALRLALLAELVDEMRIADDRQGGTCLTMSCRLTCPSATTGVSRMGGRGTIQDIRNVVARGQLREPFSASEVDRRLGITYAGTFLPKHRVGNPGGYTELFIRVSTKPARYRLR